MWIVNCEVLFVIVVVDCEGVVSCELWTSELWTCELWTCDCWLWIVIVIVNCELWNVKCEMWNVNVNVWVVSCELVNCEFVIVELNCELWIVIVKFNCELWIVNYELVIVDLWLRIVKCKLVSCYCELWVIAYKSLDNMFSSLWTKYFVYIFYETIFLLKIKFEINNIFCFLVNRPKPSKNRHTKTEIAQYIFGWFWVWVFIIPMLFLKPKPPKKSKFAQCSPLLSIWIYSSTIGPLIYGISTILLWLYRPIHGINIYHDSVHGWLYSSTMLCS